MRAGNRRSSQKLVQLILPERQPRTERDIGSTIPEDESWKLELLSVYCMMNIWRTDLHVPVIRKQYRTFVVRGFVFPGSVPDSGQVNVVFSCVRNRSAIGENVWYFFHTRYSFVSSRGVSGRNVSPLPGEVSTSLLNVR